MIQRITRQEAIQRIHFIAGLKRNFKYRDLVNNSQEESISVKHFVEDMAIPSLAHLEDWSNGMLADQMDTPFYRLRDDCEYRVEDDDV